MDALHLVELFDEVAEAIGEQIRQIDDWGLSGQRDGQYTIDVAADEIAVEMLRDAGLGVLSEESGVTASERPIRAIVDPIDGSTNASAGLPWFGTSICAVDVDGPVASLVVNQATGDRWHAMRRQGAWKNDAPIEPSSVTEIGDSFVAVSGLPTHHFGWRQFRCYGAAALDICAVADGTFDGFADLSVDAHGSWDYLGALLVCQEAGGSIVDLHDRDLAIRSHDARRTPIAAATPELLRQLVNAAKESMA